MSGLAPGTKSHSAKPYRAKQGKKGSEETTPVRGASGLQGATEALMNDTDNAPDRKMSKPVDNNRENNEGYFPKIPNHTNDLFVQENGGDGAFPCINFLC